MNKHTQGPWYLATTVTGDLAIVPKCKPPQRKVCVIPTITADFTEEEQTANAALICAAPEMLEALKKDCQRIKQLGDMVNSYANRLGLGKKVHVEDFMENAIKAINKAENNQ